MTADLKDGAGLVLAVRSGGPPITCVCDVDNVALTAKARWHLTAVDAKQQIQRHTVQHIPSRTLTQ